MVTTILLLELSGETGRSCSTRFGTIILLHIMNYWTQTNSLLESFNRTWNSLAGSKPNVWGILEMFGSQEAETRRKFLANSVGQDMQTNTGKKQRSMNSRDRLMFLVQAFTLSLGQNTYNKLPMSSIERISNCDKWAYMYNTVLLITLLPCKFVVNFNIMNNRLHNN